MTSHCANPACAVPLRLLNNGRLFQFEVRPKASAGDGAADDDSRRTVPGISRKVSHFWLCGQCASQLTLIFDKVRGVVVRPFRSI